MLESAVCAATKLSLNVLRKRDDGSKANQRRGTLLWLAGKGRSKPMLGQKARSVLVLFTQHRERVATTVAQLGEANLFLWLRRVRNSKE